MLTGVVTALLFVWSDNSKKEECILEIIVNYFVTLTADS